jgi:hypothetical protein
VVAYLYRHYSNHCLAEKGPRQIRRSKVSL